MGDRELKSRLVSIALLVSLVVFDVIMVESVLKPLGAVGGGYERVYHFALFYLLAPSLMLLFLACLEDWRVVAYPAAGLYFGAGDLLYYALLLEPLPDRFTWVWGEPTSYELAARAVSSISLVAALDYAASGGRARRLYYKLVSRS